MDDAGSQNILQRREKNVIFAPAMLNVFNFSSKPYKLGVALSGGGARGFAHAGALKALAEMGLKPDIVAGVSAGSVVTALYAGGNDPDKILELFSGIKFTDFAEIGVPHDGFFSMDGFKKFLRKNIPYENIEQLPLPAVICATDLDNGVPVGFTSGAIAERVAASCSIPIIFKPVKIDGTTYVDGGVLHNLPSWALRDKCKYLIGINCSPMPRRGKPKTIMEVAHRTYDLMAKTNAIPDMKLCDLAIQVSDIASYKVFNLREIKRVFHAGYAATMTALQENGFTHPDVIAARKRREGSSSSFFSLKS